MPMNFRFLAQFVRKEIIINHHDKLQTLCKTFT